MEFVALQNLDSSTRRIALLPAQHMEANAKNQTEIQF